MTEGTQAAILDAWNRLPSECRSRLATPAELVTLESVLGRIPADYGWFLTCCGGGPVGSEWVDGIESLPAIHRAGLCL